jgi:GT2 family glycosyltransferase
MTTSSKPSFDIVIVNWNSGEQLHCCLESIARGDRGSFVLERVCVVDNASEDKSMEGIEKYYLPVHIIHNNSNQGFATACNQGAIGSRADYLLFVNPDIRLYADSLTKPLAFMQEGSSGDIGIVGVQLVGDGGDVARSCSRFPTPRHFVSRMLGLDRLFPRWFPGYRMLEWDHQESQQVDHVMGAFFLVRRSVFDDLHGFDERFFLYLEDLDFSLRAHRAGWRSFYFADARAYHRGGGISSQARSKRLFYSLESQIKYAHKHFSGSAATGLVLGTLLVEPFTRFVWATVRRSGREIVETVEAYLILYRSMPMLLMKAWQERRYEGFSPRSL